jgi:predicted esterase
MHKISKLIVVVAAAVVALTSTAVAGPPPPGKVVSVEQLPAQLWLPNTSDAKRLIYTSTTAEGRATVVSGTVFLPQGNAPKHGWPVVSWAHGTLGVADNCANSTNGRSQRDIDYLGRWLGAGYAVVASDYEGLGTPGAHPYLNGRSEAHGVIDIVRAAHRITPNLSRSWISVGQSQGAQAALYVGSLEHKYAPELDYRGTIATAPPSRYAELVNAYRPFGPGAGPANPFAVLVLAGLEASNHFNPTSYLTPYGQELYSKAKTNYCLTQIGLELATHTADDVYAVNADEEKRALRLLSKDAEIPIRRYAEPVFIGQGTLDTVVYPPSTTTTVSKLQKVGNSVTFKVYAGADHNGVVPAATTDAIAWAGARFH